MEAQMKAYVTSIGESTTALCIWALQRNGFEVVEIRDSKTTLAEKLEQIYLLANEDFIRIDADMIVNKNFTPDFLTWLEFKNPDVWWWQFRLFDWLKLDFCHSIGYIKKEALPALRDNIKRHLHSSRAETEMSRIAEFYSPRRFDSYNDEIMGLHGYKADIDRAKRLKHIRNQQELYDFEMAERLNDL